MEARRQEALGCQEQEMLNHICGKKQPPGSLEMLRELGAGWEAIGKLPLPGCFGQTLKVSLHKLIVLSQPAFGPSPLPLRGCLVLP